MRISDRSSDVCSSDLKMRHDQPDKADRPGYRDRAADADDDPKQQPKPQRAKPDAERARAVLAKRQRIEIGSATRRERVCQYVSVEGVAVVRENQNTRISHRTKRTLYIVSEK